MAEVQENDFLQKQAVKHLKPKCLRLFMLTNYYQNNFKTRTQAPR